MWNWHVAYIGSMSMFEFLIDIVIMDILLILCLMLNFAFCSHVDR